MGALSARYRKYSPRLWVQFNLLSYTVISPPNRFSGSPSSGFEVAGCCWLCLRLRRHFILTNSHTLLSLLRGTACAISLFTDVNFVFVPHHVLIRTRQKLSTGTVSRATPELQSSENLPVMSQELSLELHGNLVGQRKIDDYKTRQHQTPDPIQAPERRPLLGYQLTRDVP
jgi:hypothetical protein